MISQPHFYQGEDKLWKMFDGMSDPMLDPARYETYSLVEPYTGASLSTHARLQVFLFSEFLDISIKIYLIYKQFRSII